MYQNEKMLKYSTFRMYSTEVTERKTPLYSAFISVLKLKEWSNVYLIFHFFFLRFLFISFLRDELKSVNKFNWAKSLFSQSKFVTGKLLSFASLLHFIKRLRFGYLMISIKFISYIRYFLNLIPKNRIHALF